FGRNPVCQREPRLVDRSAKPARPITKSASPELNLARSCDGRRLQRSIAWNVCSPTVDEGCHAGTKVSPVQQIESLSSELNLHLLAQQIVVFEERKIEAFQTGSTQRVAPEIAQRAERRK